MSEGDTGVGRGHKDLLVSTFTPALGSGRAMRTYALARALAASSGLDLLYVPFGAAEPDAAFREIHGIELHDARPSRGLRRGVSYARARASGVPDALARAVSPELVAAAAQMAGAPGRARVIADGPTAAAATMSLARRRPVIYNAHNLESSFRQELEDMSESDQRRLVAFETSVLERFDEAWMVSDADIDGARSLSPDAKLRYVPNVVDVATIAPVRPDRDARRAIYVASFSYKPNRTALEFLCAEVMPRVWEQLPDARLAVAGAGLAVPPSDDPRVSVLGFVENLQPEYERSSCAVVPLLQGGGTPLKLVEALARGLPVVATSRAAAGLRLDDGVDCLLANGAEQFANVLSRVLRDGAPEIASAGRAIAEREYSIETLRALLA